MPDGSTPTGCLRLAERLETDDDLGPPNDVLRELLVARELCGRRPA